MSSSWSTPGEPAPPAQFRRGGAWLVAIAVMAASLGGLGAAYWLAQTGQGVPVLVLSRTVLQGDVIRDGDLAIVEARPGDLPIVPATARDEVVGTRALETLPAGSALAPGSFGQPPRRDGTSQVRLRLSPSQIPSCPLPGGQALILIGLPGADDPGGVPLLVGARVVYPPVAQVDGAVVMDVAVATGDVAGLAPYLLDARVVAVVSP